MRLYRIKGEKRLYPIIWMENSVVVYSGFNEKRKYYL